MPSLIKSLAIIIWPSKYNKAINITPIIITLKAKKIIQRQLKQSLKNIIDNVLNTLLIVYIPIIIPNNISE